MLLVVVQIGKHFLDWENLSRKNLCERVHLNGKNFMAILSDNPHIRCIHTAILEDRKLNHIHSAEGDIRGFSARPVQHKTGDASFTLLSNVCMHFRPTTMVSKFPFISASQMYPQPYSKEFHKYVYIHCSGLTHGLKMQPILLLRLPVQYYCIRA